VRFTTRSIEADRLQLAGVGAVVVRLGELPVRVEDLDQEQGGSAGGVRGGAAAAGEPLADDAVVLPPADGGVEPAEVDVPAAEGDDGLAAGLVLTVRGILVDETGHRGRPPSAGEGGKTVCTVLCLRT
jgi:hypothetical protein